MQDKNQSPTNNRFEDVNCYLCDSDRSQYFIEAEDDLSGNPGRFSFVRCEQCGLVYQSPRIKFEHITEYYDNEYIAHRKKTDWGIFTSFYEWAMNKHDRDKLAIVKQFFTPDSESKVLDIGCGSGSFLAYLARETSANTTGIDIKDLSDLPWMESLEFLHGTLSEQDFGDKKFDLITMWHYLEHDYQPLNTLRLARSLLAPEGHMIIEVPRLDSLSFKLFENRWPGLQAPQHTLLFDSNSLQSMLLKADLKLVRYLPYGAFPSYFYLFCGVAFKFLKGKGLNLSRAVYPYFVGQLLLSPLLLFERKLNLAMQTAVCKIA